MSAQTPMPAEAGDSLAIALITSSDAPSLLLTSDLSIIAASASFGRVFQVDPVDARGQSLFSLGEGEWNVAQLRALLRSTFAGNVGVASYEMDLVRRDQEPQQLVIVARKLDFADGGNARLLMTASDVTSLQREEKRISQSLRDKDRRLRDDEILLKELGSRVANSLQIIASVLLQSAQRVVSDEARGHLFNAHSRVISVATVQKQLMVAGSGVVRLEAYLTDLCDSLGASMIRDSRLTSLHVIADDSLVPAETSVSLGLIVTELVINALRHAFPDRRPGSVIVNYHADGERWTLSVTDDGIGMPADRAASPPGLGTSLIEALARQLSSVTTVTDAKPGTTVSIVHG